jgi:hypothetical protein
MIYIRALSAVMLIHLVLLVALAACSGASDTGDTSSTNKDTASTTNQASSEDTTATVEDSTRQDQATTGNAAPATVSPASAFGPLLPTLREMTTAPIMLPASLPAKVGSVAIEQDPNEGNPHTTGGDKYTILFLYSNPDPSQIVRPYVHYMTLGRLLASSASTPALDPTNGLGIPQQLEDVALPDGTKANLKRLDPPQGANYGPFTMGTFEEEGYRYTVLIENDSPEGDVTRQILSTMVKVPDSEINATASP